MAEQNPELENLTQKLSLLDNTQLKRVSEFLNMISIGGFVDSEKANLVAIVKSIETAALLDIVKRVMKSTMYMANDPVVIAIPKENMQVPLYLCLAAIRSNEAALKELEPKYQAAIRELESKPKDEKAKENADALKANIEAAKWDTASSRESIPRYAQFDVSKAFTILNVIEAKEELKKKELSEKAVLLFNQLGKQVVYNEIYYLQNIVKTKGTITAGAYSLTVYPAQDRQRRLELRMTMSKEYSPEQRLKPELEFIAAVEAKLAEGKILVSKES